MKKLILTLATICFLTSCTNNQFKNDTQANKALKQMWTGFFAQDFNETKALNVLVITNRRSNKGAFGCDENSFGVGVANNLQYGVCKVNVPKNHKTGDLNFTKDNRQSSNDYFKILEAKGISNLDMINQLKNSRRTPLVFVHGFNVPFGEALLRAAQIAYDLKYQGPIVLFTWPAGAEDGILSDAMLNKTYANNLTNAKTSVSSFKSFLTDLQNNDIKINLAVHSMGHQVVLPALKQLGQLGEANSKKFLVGELILNAPDFETSSFKAMIADIKKVSQHVTLYCSYNDKAMIASRSFNKNDRLGACATINGVDSVNVGLIDDTAFGLGHGYYSSRAILTDVFQILLGIDVDKRLFIKKSELNSQEQYFLRQ